MKGEVKDVDMKHLMNTYAEMALRQSTMSKGTQVPCIAKAMHDDDAHHYFNEEYVVH
jgi:hypothetical protein